MAEPVVPPAPERFSMMNCWPIWSESLGSTMRAVMSFAPPGGNGMITRTGLLG